MNPITSLCRVGINYVPIITKTNWLGSSTNFKGVKEATLFYAKPWRGEVGGVSGGGGNGTFAVDKLETR